ncbi:MAG: hypothetical protein JWM62_1576 [Frankiales bacterium]|jgi:hypothetical protein|nr:hypothetical protein [Frankiales bacterium]
MSAAARLGAVGVLLVAGLALGQANAGPAPSSPEPTAVPVLTGTAVCPDVRQDGDRGRTTVGAAGGATREGGPLAGPLRKDAPLPERFVGPFLVQAQGAGLVVEQATRATTGGRRGTSSVTCSAPVTSAWFVGGATTLGSFTELVLVNAGELAALVDVQVWTADGPADPRSGRGVSVPPRSRVVVLLDRLAPDRDLLALHVRTTRGQVAPALRVIRSDGRTPLGTDWVPTTVAPARGLVVPGLPAGPGRRTALLTNPGADDATAALALVTTDGEVSLEAVTVPAGTSVAVDLSEQLARTPAALRVTADVPVLAGASVVDGQSGRVREIAFSAAAPAIEQPALLADVRLAAATEVTLLLTASSGDAVVDVVPLAAPGELPQPLRVDVPASTTAAVRLSRFLPQGSSGALTLELRPVSGQVHAARYSRERGRSGPLTTLLPVGPQPRTVLRPVVVAEP